MSEPLDIEAGIRLVAAALDLFNDSSTIKAFANIRDEVESLRARIRELSEEVDAEKSKRIAAEYGAEECLKVIREFELKSREQDEVKKRREGK